MHHRPAIPVICFLLKSNSSGDEHQTIGVPDRESRALHECIFPEFSNSIFTFKRNGVRAFNELVSALANSISPPFASKFSRREN